MYASEQYPYHHPPGIPGGMVNLTQGERNYNGLGNESGSKAAALSRSLSVSLSLARALSRSRSRIRSLLDDSWST